MMNFLKYYIKSMRLPYGFITGFSGWVGIELYQYLHKEMISPVRFGLILFVLFLSYGINQIVNDYLGLEEDRINAPNRPMVTGALNYKLALSVSGILMGGLTIIAYFVNPMAALVVVLGGVLNIVYEFAKRFSLLGNVTFALSITMCPVFAYYASNFDTISIFHGPGRWVLFFCFMICFFMTYFTYFKDYEGDKATGVKTFVVKYGIPFASKAGFASLVVPLSLFGYITRSVFPVHNVLISIFLVLFFFVMQFMTAYKYFKTPTGDETYYNLKTNIQATVIGFCAVGSIFSPITGVCMAIIAFFGISFLFNRRKDAKA